jgi:hypothetical protein
MNPVANICMQWKDVHITPTCYRLVICDEVAKYVLIFIAGKKFSHIFSSVYSGGQTTVEDGMKAP